MDIIRTVYYIHDPWRAKKNFCCFICVSYGPYTLLQNDSFLHLYQSVAVQSSTNRRCWWFQTWVQGTKPSSRSCDPSFLKAPSHFHSATYRPHSPNLHGEPTTGSLRLIVHVFKTPKPICTIFETLQCRFVQECLSSMLGLFYQLFNTKWRTFNNVWTKSASN